MTAQRQHRTLAWAWLAVVCLALVYNAKVWLLDRRPLETDFLALLPADKSDPAVRAAFDRVAQSAEQNVLVLVGARDWAEARKAGAAYAAVLATHSEWFTTASLTAIQSDSALAPWWENRHGLLTVDDQAALRTTTPDVWVQRALGDLLSPMGSGRVGAWQDDPFGFFRRWMQDRASETPVRPVDGVLRVDDGDMHYVVLPMQLRAQAFALAAQRDVIPLLQQAHDSATAHNANITVRSAGLIFPAAAAAAQANHELSTIGWGSIAGIILITWVTFRSLRPIALVLLSLGVGTLGALAVTAFFYQNVHLLTLVFGASLIGVAEDYGMHYLCVSNREARGGVAVIRDLLPGLSLALLTTVVSFVGLGVSPFPGLQQIAAFSAVGLVAAWVTVVAWFPVLDGRNVGRARVIEWFNWMRVRWMALSHGAPRYWLAGATLVASAVGIARLHANDDIRLLQSLPEGMLQEQDAVGRILDVPFGGQLYVVRGNSAQQVLEREEALRVRLDSLVGMKELSGYQAISTWVPSLSAQHANVALLREHIYAPDGALHQLRRTLQEPAAWEQSRREAFAAGRDAPLTPERWLASSMSEPLRPLWLGNGSQTTLAAGIGAGAPARVDAKGVAAAEHESGQPPGEWASVITLKNVDDAALPKLALAAHDLNGVVWADKVASISAVLGEYRVRMSWVLAMSYVVIGLIFIPRYGRSSWRILAPSVVASAVSLAVLGMFGQPLQLFHILALYLVFGLGVDYAIFLSEQTHSAEADVSFAVGLAAISTVLSLGLLALSATPVLHAFGLVMLVGVTVSLLAAPLFCSARPPAVTPNTGSLQVDP